MIVISRKKYEKVSIGDSIVITITEIRGNKVRIGIEAPKDIVIARSELIKEYKDGSSESRDNKETGNDIYGKSTEVP